VLAERGIEIARMPEARRGLKGAVGYVELHIEQGPVLERLGLPLATVVGTAGVDRHVVTFTGQASHAGSTPMESRRDPLAAAARLVLAVREDAVEAGGVATVGSCVTRPGIATATAAEAVLTLDQRHFDAEVLVELVRRAERRSEVAAEEEAVEVAWTDLWSIKPIRFDEELTELADAAIRDLGATPHRMPSGPLHDAAEVARAGVPTVMLFVQSLRGLSHTREEDTRPEHIELSVRALAATVDRVLGRRS
jgi:N-carbamoyl-L-amino-acid hydrolase